MPLGTICLNSVRGILHQKSSLNFLVWCARLELVKVLKSHLKTFRSISCLQLHSIQFLVIDYCCHFRVFILIPRALTTTDIRCIIYIYTQALSKVLPKILEMHTPFLSQQQTAERKNEQKHNKNENKHRKCLKSY